MNEETIMNANPGTAPHSDSENTNTMVQNLYEWVEAAVFSLTCVVLVFTFLFRIVGVDGDSMNPTLIDKDRLIITRTLYTPKTGDIVIINRYTLEPLVKRVIAVVGDTLTIDPDTHKVIVNGVTLNEPYIQGFTYPLQFSPTTQTIPKGYVFVMGDNRENSRDSRFPDIGFVKLSSIMGKAIFRFLPLSQAGGLY